jgi:SAM-dependent methyltransferase
MNPSAADFSKNIERFTGFAALYDQYRPGPPAILGALLAEFSGIAMPGLVVDLGCGTGLSTRYWAEKAREVVGIEPSADMRAQAVALTSAGNVSFREGLSHRTGLLDRCADIVSCSQALHWMEPQATFQEAARILRPGGIFSANDYDWPPTTGSWEADQAWTVCAAKGRELEKKLNVSEGLKQWDKAGHLDRMKASGCFRHTREVVMHHQDQANAERFVGLLLSQGYMMSLVKKGLTETDLGIDTLRAVARRTLGDELRPSYWSARVRVGVV